MQENETINSINKFNPLGTEKISRLLLKYSLPSVIAMMVAALYNVVDRIFIGHSMQDGALGLAAISICFPIMLINIAFVVMLSNGSATLFALSLGRNQHDKARLVLGNALILGVSIAVIFTIIPSLFLKSILVALGAKGKMLVYAHEYMRIILLGTTFSVVGSILNSILRPAGKPLLAMLTTIFGSISNIILNTIFIYGLEMGVKGAALATIISQFISFIWCFSVFTHKNSSYKLKLKDIRVDKNICKEIFKLGLPSLLLQLVNSLIILILNKTLISLGGEYVLTGYNIIYSIQNLLLLPIIGIDQGVQSIISFNYGAKNYNRVRKAEFLAIGIASMISVTAYLIVMFFPRVLVAIFINDARVMEFTTHAMRYVFFFLAFTGFTIIATGFFQAIGKPKISLTLTVLRTIIIYIPTLLILTKYMGVTGVLLTTPISNGVSLIIIFIVFSLYMKKLNKLEPKI